MTAKIGLFLPARESLLTGASITDVVTFAVRAEDTGFDSVWTGDSLLATPIPEPLTLLSAVAARTSRVTIGTAALLPVLRHPVTLAHSLATLDQLAGGRLILALGSGFGLPINRTEFAAAGARFDQRVGRLVETAAIWRRLWTGDPVTVTGRYWTLDGVALTPVPARPGGPPLWLATNNAAGAHRTGQHFDGWLPYPPTTEQYRELWATTRAAAQPRGDAVTPALMVTIAVNDDPDQAHAELNNYVHTFYGYPLDAVSALQACHAGQLADCVDWLRSYIDAGARHVLLRIGNLDPDIQLRTATQLLTELRA